MDHTNSQMTKGRINISWRTISVVASTMLLSLPLNSLADDFDAFERAAGQRGCNSIPFYRARTNCQRIQRDVKEYCKTDVVKCSELLSEKTKLIDKIKKSDGQLKYAEEKRDRLEKKLADTDVEGEIAKYKKELSRASDEYQDALDDHNELLGEYESFDDDNEVSEGYDAAQRCVKARTESNELFDEVLEHLYIDGSTLTETEEIELEHFAVKITDHIKSEIKNHETALRDANGRVTNCKKVLDKKR
jgi:hypothetical protein